MQRTRETLVEDLSRPEYEGLVQLAEAALVAETSLDWWSVFADLSLGPLFHADVVAVAAIDHRARSEGTFALVEPAWAQEAVPIGSEMHRDLLDDHPLSDHMRGPRALETVRLSDLVPQSRWRHMAGHAKMKELIGATHQLGITVTADASHSLSTSPIRAGSDFTRHEVEVADRFRPLLRAADRHTRTLADQRAQSTDAELQVADLVARGLGLTGRERVVLGLLADGLTASAAARHLAVSPRTISKHQENLYRKLGVRDRLSAVLLARRAGLLGTPTR